MPINYLSSGYENPIVVVVVTISFPHVLTGLSNSTSQISPTTNDNLKVVFIFICGKF